MSKVIDLSKGDLIAVSPLEHLDQLDHLDQVLWAKIESIEYVGEEQVYDIEVEGTHNFIANGILAHNTYLSSNVGIGTTDPGAKLDVDSGSIYISDASGAGTIEFRNLGNGEEGKIQFRKNSGEQSIAAQIVGYSADSYQRKGLSFYTGDYANYTTDADERMRITKGGDVGIGTTSPAYALDVAGYGQFAQPVTVGTPIADTHATTKSYVDSELAEATSTAENTYVNESGDTMTGALDIQQPDTGDIFNVSSSTAGDLVTITNDGNVGIGNTSPTEKLTVDLSDNASSSISNIATLYHGSDSTAGTAGIGSGMLFSAEADDDSVVNIGQIASVFNNASSTAPHTDLRLYTRNEGDLAERMRIDKSGNVGIGTTNPGAKLDVDSGSIYISDASGAGTIEFRNLGNGEEGKIQFRKTNGEQSIAAQIVAYSAGAYNKKGLSFYTGAYADYTTDADERMRITKGGDVGIGTTSPAYKLQTMGYGYFSQPVTVGTPIADTHATTKSYVDSELAEATSTAENTYVNEAGDTMTGALDIQQPDTGDIFNVSSSTAGDLMTITNDGNVGIGTTTPSDKLVVDGKITSTGGNDPPYVSFTKESRESTRIRVEDELSDKWDQAVLFWNKDHRQFEIYRPPLDEFWSLGAQGTEYANDMKLEVATNTLTWYNSSSTELVRIENSGNVGIGTTSPSHALDIVSGDLDMNGNNITGVNKLTATTVDSLYNINGNKYSTYAPSISGGVKEEYTGNAELATKTKTGNYKYVLDFNKLPEGSDQWLWYKTVDFSENNVQVMTTPKAGFVDMYYEIKDEKIIFVGDKRIEFSYRLTGDRNER